MSDCDSIKEQLRTNLPHDFEISIFKHLKPDPDTFPQFPVPTSDTSMSPKTRNSAILKDTRMQRLNRLSQTAAMPRTVTIISTAQPDETISMPSMDLTLESGVLDSLLDSAQMFTDSTYEQELPRQATPETGKIQIKCQPRSRFRPRTENERKTASHYLRCEPNSELDYPTIDVPESWACHSNANFIEVTLVDIDKQLHPYVIDNKMSQTSLDEQASIFKSNETNQLYFRLTNDDFVNRFKSFMIELVKSKQNAVITKELIRTRKLDHSMLRFVRVYRDECNVYHRDTGSEEYSCVMIESYGDVSVEQLGPLYGSMSGQEMVFVICKGRIAKDDFSVIISETKTRWSHEIKQLVLNGNTFYFPMPVFPFLHANRVSADINIYLKGQVFHRSKYLYMKILDQLVDVTTIASISDIHATTIRNDLGDEHNVNCSAALTFENTSKNKSKKRLNQKTNRT